MIVMNLYFQAISTFKQDLLFTFHYILSLPIFLLK